MQVKRNEAIMLTQKRTEEAIQKKSELKREHEKYAIQEIMKVKLVYFHRNTLAIPEV